MSETKTAAELKAALESWPIEVARSTVLEVVTERELALLVAHWLAEGDSTDDPPPLTTDQIRAIWVAMNRRRH